MKLLGLRTALVIIALIAVVVVFRVREGGPPAEAPGPALPGEAAHPANRDRAAEVVDGDTLRLVGGERVRLLGVDAPEKGHPLYQAASEACRSLLGAREVKITVAGDRAHDGYGRTLALVYAGGRLVNEEILSLGLARVYFRSAGDVPAEVAARFVRAQNRAMDGKRGLWGLPGALATARGEELVATRFRYHRAGCVNLADHRSLEAHPTPTTREAALRSGKSPCRTCNPRPARRRAPCNRRGRGPR
jgi:endonuclease YncB( thermonuclease family)